MLLRHERIPTICRRGSMNTPDRERGVAGGGTETARCFVFRLPTARVSRSFMCVVRVGGHPSSGNLSSGIASASTAEPS
jgi:hypothetical protein